MFKCMWYYHKQVSNGDIFKEVVAFKKAVGVGVT